MLDAPAEPAPPVERGLVLVDPRGHGSFQVLPSGGRVFSGNREGIGAF